MKEIIKLNKDFDLGENTKEIKSISLEANYEVTSSLVYGELLVDGTYKDDNDELSDFNFKIPFDYEIKKCVRESSINVNIIDFNYEYIDSKLHLNIEYEITGEETFDSEEEFNRFVTESDVEVVELSNEEDKQLDDYISLMSDEKINEREMTLEDDSKEIEEEQVEKLEDNMSLEKETKEEDKLQEREIKEERKVSDIPSSQEIESNILKSINMEEEFSTYHVYICNEYDSIDSVANKYKISKDLLLEYNSDVKIMAGAKLIIPFNE